MKILVRNSTTIDLIQECQEASIYLLKHGLKFEFVFKNVTFPVSIKEYRTVKGFNPVTGIYGDIKYYGLANIPALDTAFDITIDVWDLDIVKSPTDGVITSWTTDHIQLAINKYLKDNKKITNRITHEIVHNLCVIANSKGFSVTDEMDITIDGKAFLKNDFPDAIDGNYARTFKNLQAFINSLNNTMPTYKYFSAKEVVGLKPELVQKLDIMRGECGFPFKINSGLRTPEQNAKLKGSVEDSAHLTGEAVDLQCATSDQKYKMVQSAMKNGITRIGISFAGKFIHLDIDKSKPQGCIWGY